MSDQPRSFEPVPPPEQFNESLRRVAAAAAPAIRRFGEQLAAVGRLVEETTSRAYAAAGKPYGDTDEGKWRWLQEVARVGQLRAEAAEIEATHRAHSLLRQRVAGG